MREPASALGASQGRVTASAAWGRPRLAMVLVLRPFRRKLFSRQGKMAFRGLKKRKKLFFRNFLKFSYIKLNDSFMLNFLYWPIIFRSVLLKAHCFTKAIGWLRHNLNYYKQVIKHSYFLY
jgi:hypothetical protein